MKSKKKIAIIIAIIALAIILLFPIRLCLEDGGSVEYRAILYTYTDVKRLGVEVGGQMDYQEGTIVEIVGVEVYNNVE